MFYNHGSSNTDPQDAVKEIENPTQVEAYKGLMISLSNTATHPDAVMIITSDANIAVRAMCSIWWLVDIAKVTPSILG
jgi:hypothetical protein